MMGTVHRLSTGREDVTLGDAVSAFLATLDHPETAGTHRTYSSTLRAMLAGIGEGTGIAEATPAALSTWFAGQWGAAKPATWDSRRGTIRSLLNFCEEQGWIASAAAMMRGIEHRRTAPDRSRALSRADVENLLTRDGIALRERTLWRMLYETAARSAEVLRLNVEDLDLPNRRARVRRKGGAIDVIVWQTGTARLLPRLTKGRTRGPLFLTGRKARLQLPPGDLDPESGRARLSYGQAEGLFKAASGGATLHQLRHSALTHDAEDGTNTAMLMARSGHTSVTSLAKYARVSAEALARHQAGRDPARRR
jgi:integrase